VSDTPRTDDRTVIIDGNQWVNAPFARQLERELNAANVEIELLMSANADVARIAGERDAAEKRIKRLEEAGDAILNAENDDEEYKAIIQWNKAKEAKP
jgi:hypothetical protein